MRGRVALSIHKGAQQIIDECTLLYLHIFLPSSILTKINFLLYLNITKHSKQKIDEKVTNDTDLHESTWISRTKSM